MVMSHESEWRKVSAGSSNNLRAEIEQRDIINDNEERLMHERAGHLDPDGPALDYVPRNTETRIGLTSDAAKRKQIPVATGVVDYFPDAIIAIAELSRVGNEQHNPGKPLHWDRAKSGDESDALMRHFIERGRDDTDGVPHSAKVAWRALALLQKEIEEKRRGLKALAWYGE
jgi:hypothetical protein